MTLDVSAVRAAVTQAALARDEDELRRIADDLPALTAFGYERHRARAFANAIRGAHGSAVAELCLGVAACPPAAATFVADSAQLRLLGGEGAQPAHTTSPAPLVRRLDPRVLASAAALVAAVAALVILPGESLDRGGPQAAGVTAPADEAAPRVVAGEPRALAPPIVVGRSTAPDAAAPGDATLVSAPSALRASLGDGAAAPDAAPASRGAPRPAAQTPRPAAPTPTPTPPPAPAPAPAPTRTPSPAPAAAPASAAPAPAAPAPPAKTPSPAPARERGGKALGHAQAPGQLKKDEPGASATDFAPPATPAPDPPAQPGEEPGRGNAGDPPGKRP